MMKCHVLKTHHYRGNKMILIAIGFTCLVIAILILEIFYNPYSENLITEILSFMFYIAFVVFSLSGIIMEIISFVSRGG